jgi:hypothetical protein
VAKDKWKKLEAQDVDRYDFDLDRQRVETKEKVRDGKSEPFTFSEWAEKYPTFDDVKRKRSLSTDLVIIRLHLEPFFGPSLLTEITREGLCRYVDKRMGETLIRCKKERHAPISRRISGKRLFPHRWVEQAGDRYRKVSGVRRLLELASRVVRWQEARCLSSAGEI